MSSTPPTRDWTLARSSRWVLAVSLALFPLLLLRSPVRLHLSEWSVDAVGDDFFRCS